MIRYSGKRTRREREKKGVDKLVEENELIRIMHVMRVYNNYKREGRTHVEMSQRIPEVEG